MQKVLDEYNSYDDLPDELEDMRNQLIEFLQRRKKYVDERDKAIAEYKIDQRSLFITEERTVYSDQCCHFNKLGMETIIDDIMIKAEPVFRKLTVDK